MKKIPIWNIKTGSKNTTNSLLNTNINRHLKKRPAKVVKKSDDKQISRQISETRIALQLLESWDDIKELMKPNTIISLFFIFQAIITIFCITALACFFPLVFFCGIPLFGLLYSRSLRALGNQCHDISHSNIFTNRKFNKLIGKYILMPLMFYVYDIYDYEHIKIHHPHLSDPNIDQDHIPVYHEPYKGGSIYMALFCLLKPQVWNKKNWLSSTFGHIANKQIDFNSKLIIFLFWIVLISLLIIIFGYINALAFFLLWIGFRGTFYHVHKQFVELVDHYNLPRTSVISNCRIMPQGGFWAYIWHCDNDGFHTPHHIFQNIPLPNIKRAHDILYNNLDEYKKGNIYSNYKEVILSLIN